MIIPILELLSLIGGLLKGRFNESIKFDFMSKQVFDESFKKMTIDLSYARGSVKEVAEELGIDPGRKSKWRQQHSLLEKSPVRLTEEQKQISRLQKRTEGGADGA